MSGGGELSGINVVKVFYLVTKTTTKKAREFVLDKFLQVLHSRVGSWPYPQTLD